MDGQTHTVDYRGASPPDAELPAATDELTFALNGYVPVRCRVLAVIPVPCPRKGTIKYIRVDLGTIQ